MICASDARLDRVHAAGRNGIDGVEVADDRLHLCVTFLAGIPADLTPAHLRLEGGRQERRVVSMRRRPSDDQHDEACLELTLDRPAEPVTYRLCVIELDERGRPTGAPCPGFDQRYHCADVRFDLDCDDGLDCREEDDCPAPAVDLPPIDYLVRDYPGFRRLLLDRMRFLVPDWQERHVPDLGVALVELLAHLADGLAYAQDAVATEAHLGTARRRISVRRHCRLLDYVLGEGANARAFVSVEVTGAATYTAPAAELVFLTRFAGAPPAGTVLDGAALPAGGFEAFQPVADPEAPITFAAARNTLHLWTWGDAECCLPAGSTSATLVAGETVHLAPGDLLLLEEVLGPRTGDPADADPAHRHVVRLTEVTPARDDLYDEDLLTVAWDEADALPFALCVSAVSAPPECRLLQDVSVARGNVVLVDHGRPAPPETLDPVPVPPPAGCCAGPCLHVEHPAPPVRHRPRPLAARPLTFAAPAPGPGEPAVAMLTPDPRRAVPALWLEGTGPDGAVERWEARPDLLASGPDDRHVVVEIDDEGAAHLRFGDDVLGEAPEPGTAFTAHARVGNGRAGEVGAEAIGLAARRGTQEAGVGLVVRNPLPARGGADPEPIAMAKQHAPAAFRERRERAIVPEDYAAIALRDVPALQAAAATLRWNGSGYEVLVALDQRGRGEPDADVVEAVAAALARVRRMGHDVRLAPAVAVPLLVRLSVCVAPHHARTTVAAALRDELSSRALPGARTGLFHPDRWQPGSPVAVSPLVAAAQAVVGVESVEVVALRRLHAPPGTPAVPEGGVLALGPLEVAVVDSDRRHPHRGRVELDLRGGR